MREVIVVRKKKFIWTQGKKLLLLLPRLESKAVSGRWQTFFIEIIPANKKIEASTLYDDELLEKSYLNKFIASNELLILHEEQLKTIDLYDLGHSLIKSTVRLDKEMESTVMTVKV